MFDGNDKITRYLSISKHSLQSITGSYKLHTNIPFTRSLNQSIPCDISYKRRKGEVKTVIHWGQRKLLMSEIEFLTLYSKNNDIVIYAGAAPGTHTNYLSKLFKNINFILIDPAPFNCKETNKIKIINDFFTNDLAEQYKNKQTLFISDIRSVDWSQSNDEEVEEKVKRDMDMQRKWVEILQPRYSMLKFRLPWKDGNTKYFDGVIYLPVWGPVTTSESRLITDGRRYREYNNINYENQMYYFNTIMRPSLYMEYKRLIKCKENSQGLDYCYDCTAEIFILKQYLEKYNRSDSSDNVFIDIIHMSNSISGMLSSTRNLLSPNVDPGERKKHIIKKQYKKGKPVYNK